MARSQRSDKPETRTARSKLSQGARSDWPAMLLQGYHAVVTGGGAGLGAATARGFFNAGAQVIVSDINAQNAARVAREIDPSGTRAKGMRCDITNADECAQLVAAAEAFFCAPLGLFLANAGVGFAGDLRTVDPERIRRTIEVNVTGSLLSAQAALRSLTKSNHGCLLFTGSLQGVTSRPQRSAYTASKHAIVGMVKALAVEFGPLGVRVNAIAPASIDGALLRSQLAHSTSDLDAAVAKVGASMPLGRLPSIDDFVNTAVFLASPMARSISGHHLLVDCGAAAGISVKT